MKNKIFVFTGNLGTLKRPEAKQIVESRGGTVSSAISKKTDYLVAGEKAGSKLQKAQVLGVKVLTLQQFLDLVNPAKITLAPQIHFKKIAEATKKASKEIEALALALKKLAEDLRSIHNPEKQTLAQKLNLVTIYPLYTTEDVVRIAKRQLENKYIKNIDLLDLCIRCVTISAALHVPPVEIVLNFHIFNILEFINGPAEEATKKSIETLDRKV